MWPHTLPATHTMEGAGKLEEVEEQAVGMRRKLTNLVLHPVRFLGTTQESVGTGL